MHRHSLISLVAITLVSLMLALLLLPGIAGLVEGDFNYLCWELDRGWNNRGTWNDEPNTIGSALSEVYAWSFWRIGLREQEPYSYTIYSIIQSIRVIH